METISKQYISNNRERGSYTTIFKHYYGESEKKVNKQGDIYALVKISAEKSVNTERIAKFVWDSIVDGYLYSTCTTTNESLKEAISKGVAKVKELIKNDKELEETGVDVSFTIVLVKEEGTYVGIFGEGDIFVFKKGSLANISEILKEKNANTAGVSLEEKDVLMISTSKLLGNKVNILSRLNKREDFQKTLDTIGGQLNGTESVMYFLKGKKEKEVIVKEKKKIIPSVEGIKNGAEKILAPIARIEKIRKPKNEQTKISDLTKKIKLKEKFDRIKYFFNRVWGKFSPFVKKFGSFLGEKWERIKESVVKSFGRKRWYKKIAAKWSQVSVKKRKPVGIQGMKIDSYKDKSLKSKRFKMFAMFVVVVILLVLGINFTIKMKEAREVSNLAQEVFSQVDDLLKKIEDNFVIDRDSAETYLFQAERVLDEEVPEGLNEKDTERYEDLRERVLELGDALYKRVGVMEKDSRLSNFLESRLAFGEGSEVVDLAIYEDRLGNEYLVAADLGGKAIQRVSLYDKSVMALPDNDGLISKPRFVYVGNTGVYVFDEARGMLKAPFDEEGWFTAFVALSGLGANDIRATDISAMTVWTEADNVYFLSRDREAFLRSTAAYGERYGLAYEYFGHEKMAFSTDMTADISIYIIVSEEPHILRFNYSYFEGKYVEAPLGTIGFDGNFGELTKAFTGSDLTYPLYVFDSQGRRFLQLQKPIEAGADIRHPNQVSLLNQYLYRGEKDSVWSDVKNFVVDADESNMYILDGNVIWKLVL